MNTQTYQISNRINTKPKPHKHYLNIFYLNIRSIVNKFTELKMYLSMHKEITYHIIVITETWLSEQDTQFYQLDGYHMYSSTRSNRSGHYICT